jgi:UDP-N-acetylglucosamine 2-epimerase (non-hydrolysing)/GDP/UDP-N,N'-diacetylbacillosamine 2-epimerase (hydrolysing)
MKRTIAIFTGKRAEYGPQYPIIKAINAHPDLTAICSLAGRTWTRTSGPPPKSEIERDGFASSRGEDDHAPRHAGRHGPGHRTASSAFPRGWTPSRPDFLVVYADRSRGLAAHRGTQMGFHRAHRKAATTGAAPGHSVRHAMTKLVAPHLPPKRRPPSAFCAQSWARSPGGVQRGLPALDLIARAYAGRRSWPTATAWTFRGRWPCSPSTP